MTLPATVRNTFANAYAPVYPSDGTALLASAVTMLKDAPLVKDLCPHPASRFGSIQRARSYCSTATGIIEPASIALSYKDTAF